MVNVNMLKAKIIEKNIEKKKIAECLGISHCSFFINSSFDNFLYSSRNLL